MSEPMLDAAGRRRSPATLPDFRVSVRFGGEPVAAIAG
jgi:hypothetical protein